MKPLHAVATILALLAAPPANAQPASPAPCESGKSVRVAIPSGSAIQLATRDLISSKKQVKGDLVHLSVLEPLLIDGHTAIAAGTSVVGELTHVETKRAFGVSGAVRARLLYVELPGGPVRLSGELAQDGRNNGTAAVATAAAVGTLAFIVTGKSAEIPAGTRVTGFIDREAKIDAPAICNPPTTVATTALP